MSKTLHRLVNRVVPMEWERELAELSPPTNRFKFLRLIWEPGYPWEPVERYIIYEMVPERMMNSPFMAAVLEQLADPHPPSMHGNYYDTTLEEFVRNEDCLITERAWHLFRETQCWGRPYWVIQGTKGGHKRWFSTIEQKLLKMQGLPQHPPAPGDLPYAEWDERVKKQLQTLDMMDGIHGELRRRNAIARGTTMSQDLEKEQQIEFRTMLIKWLHDQTDEIAPDVHKGLIDSDAGRAQGDMAQKEKVWEQAEQDFIETGDSKRSLITLAK